MPKLNPWAIALALALSISVKIKYDESGLQLEVSKLKTELAEAQTFQLASACEPEVSK
jgi:hypothetical protein